MTLFFCLKNIFNIARGSTKPAQSYNSRVQCAIWKRPKRQTKRHVERARSSCARITTTRDTGRQPKKRCRWWTRLFRASTQSLCRAKPVFILAREPRCRNPLDETINRESPWRFPRADMSQIKQRSCPAATQKLRYNQDNSYINTIVIFTNRA